MHQEYPCNIVTPSRLYFQVKKEKKEKRSKKSKKEKKSKRRTSSSSSADISAADSDDSDRHRKRKESKSKRWIYSTDVCLPNFLFFKQASIKKWPQLNDTISCSFSCDCSIYSLYVRHTESHLIYMQNICWHFEILTWRNMNWTKAEIVCVAMACVARPFDRFECHTTND